jgi:hypothetical protein
MKDEARDMEDAVNALRAGDLDAAEAAIQSLRRELREEITGTDSYVPVFLLTLLLVVGVPLGNDHPLVSALLTVAATASVILALQRSHIRPRPMRWVTIAAIGCGVANIVIIVAVEAGNHPTVLVATSSLLFALLLAVTFPAILRRVLTSHAITVNTLAGTITAYLLLGLFFATLFRFISVVTPDPFFLQKVTPGSSDFEYFSFITITTVGYGDLSPLSDAARAGAVFEAIMGQVFLVTIVARVVSSLGFQHERPAAPSDVPADVGDEV